jgi:hypothetical protein
MKKVYSGDERSQLNRWENSTTETKGVSSGKRSLLQGGEESPKGLREDSRNERDLLLG